MCLLSVLGTVADNVANDRKFHKKLPFLYYGQLSLTMILFWILKNTQFQSIQN